MSKRFELTALLIALCAASCSPDPDDSLRDAGTSDVAMMADATVSADASSEPDDGQPAEDMGTNDLGENDAGVVPTGTCGQAEGQLLWPDAPWNQRVDQRPKAADSDAVIAYLAANQTAATTFQIDFSLKFYEVDASVPRRAFTPNDGHYSPDCDTSDVPVPPGGELEGEDGYACEGDGDCHLLVVSPADCRLYEMWRANIVNDEFDGGCLAVWDLEETYADTLRGDYCTSADAAGLPITPLLATADEVAAGEIRHALRFILPNARIRSDVYVRPGTHSTRATSGPAEAPPYSGLLRLRGDVDLSALTPAQQTIARALQNYGMYLADGGNITFTMASDRTTTHTWEDVGIGPHDMKWLEWTDFEMVDAGPGITWSDGDCQRTPIED